MTDKELLKKLKKDKDSGLSLVIDLYSGLLYKIAANVIMPLGTSEDVEECVSDSLLAFYGEIENIDPKKASIRAYLAVITRRKAIDCYRKLTQRPSYTLDGDGSPYVQSEDFTLSADRKAFLLSAIKALGEPDSTIITRKYYLGETAAEIGAKLNMSEVAVQKRLERCKQKLKTQLGGVMYG